MYAVQEASAFDDNSEVAWITQVWKPGMQHSDFDSEKIGSEFKTLDQKLARALRNGIKTEGTFNLRIDMDALRGICN